MSLHLEAVVADPPVRAGRGRRALVAAVALALAAPSVVAGWWLTHPDALYPAGGVTVTAPAPVGQPVVADANVDWRMTVTLISARVNVVANTADAEIEVVLCTPPAGGVKAGAITAPVQAYCASATGVRGHELGARTSAYLLLVVTPHRHGVVRVRGLELTYRQGLRRGHQLTGGEFILKTA